MSPFRVLVSDTSSTKVLAAMLSVDKLKQTRTIYIIHKAVPRDENMLPSKSVAHIISGKRNSVILAKYEIIHDFDEMKSYLVKRCEDNQLLEDEELTQQDCLRSAMYDFCQRESLSILQIL